jgi:predicted PurR-regulated permease PerM
MLRVTGGSRSGRRSMSKAESFGRNFLLLLLLVVGVIFFKMTLMFMVPLILAAVFCSLFYGYYEKMVRWTHGRKGLGAAACCFLLLLLLLIPLYLLAHMVSTEALALYDSAESAVKEIIAQGDQGVLGSLARHPMVQRLGLNRIDWQASLQDVLKNTASLVANVLNAATKSTFSLLTNLFLTLFTMFYFFKDGHKLIERLKTISPLADKYEDILINRFMSVSRATLKGTLLIGLLKGLVGGLSFWIFGIRSPILWGMVMAILSLIPMIGAWLVMYPAAIVLMILGQVWQGVLLFIIAVAVVSNIDNVLQPRLVGREAGMHDLLIFFSTIGGIAMFGMMGFLIGPIIAAFFITLLDVYVVEFRQQITQSKKR